MERQHISQRLPTKTSPFLLRKVAKSGSSRYISVNKLVPNDWQAVKAYVIESKGDYCVLKLVKIA